MGSAPASTASQGLHGGNGPSPVASARPSVNATRSQRPLSYRARSSRLPALSRERHADAGCERRHPAMPLDRAAGRHTMMVCLTLFWRSHSDPRRTPPAWRLAQLSGANGRPLRQIRRRRDVTEFKEPRPPRDGLADDAELVFRSDPSRHGRSSTATGTRGTRRRWRPSWRTRRGVASRADTPTSCTAPPRIARTPPRTHSPDAQIPLRRSERRNGQDRRVGESRRAPGAPQDVNSCQP